MISIVGHNLIHKVGKVASVLGVVGFGYLVVRLFTQHDVPAVFADAHFDVVPFLLAVALGAGWQLTFGPYVADYSRYLPEETPERTVFWSTFGGSVLGSQLSMTFGVLVAPVAGDAFLTNQVAWLGGLAGAAVLAALIYLLIMVGKLTVTCLNAYGSFMCASSTVTAFTRRKRVSQATRTAFILAMLVLSMLIAIWASADFLANFKNFVLLLLIVFTPWSAINLTDYHLISKEKVDLPALYDPNDRYGRWNAAALTTYTGGIAVQARRRSSRSPCTPALSRRSSAGPTRGRHLLDRRARGACDMYYLWASRRNVAPAEMIRMPRVETVASVEEVVPDVFVARRGK